jgi:uncharacterized membrane protein
MNKSVFEVGKSYIGFKHSFAGSYSYECVNKNTFKLTGTEDTFKVEIKEDNNAQYFTRSGLTIRSDKEER